MNDKQEPAQPSEITSPETAAKDAAKADRPARRGAPGLKGFVGGLLGGAAVSALAAAALIAFAPSVKPLLLSVEIERIDRIDQNLQDMGRKQTLLDGRLRLLSETPQPAPVAQTAERPATDPAAEKSAAAASISGDLASRVQAQAAELAELRAEMARLRGALPAEGTILKLAERAEQAEQAVRTVAGQRQTSEALLLAVGQLKNAIDRGDAYTTELKIARRLASPENAVRFDLLSESAASGLPTRASLAGTFPAMADAALRAETAPQGQDLWSRVLRRLQSFVTIRHLATDGADSAAILARAEAALDQDDLAQAITEMKALQGPAATAAADWLGAAERRLNADRTLSELTATAIEASVTIQQP